MNGSKTCSFPAAGDAYRRSAEIQMKLGNRVEAGTQFVDCANCFKKLDRNGKFRSIILKCNLSK